MMKRWMKKFAALGMVAMVGVAVVSVVSPSIFSNFLVFARSAGSATSVGLGRSSPKSISIFAWSVDISVYAPPT